MNQLNINLIFDNTVKKKRIRNKEKDREYARQWALRNPEKVKENNKNRKRTKKQHSEYMKAWRIKEPEKAKSADLKKQYGITIDDYNKKLQSQNCKCAVCGSLQGKRALAVDHNHSTGEIRDLLCHRCNTSIGLMDESIDKLKALISYLEKWNK